MTPIDRSFARTRAGDLEGFAAWVRLCEPALRASLRSFAARVDTEALVQEALKRMWVAAPTLDLSGENASRAFACRLARNLALNELKRRHPVPLADVDFPPEPSVAPEPPADEGLRDIIRRCFERLPRKPRSALGSRVESGGTEPDVALAKQLDMKLNTFLQNIVRARKLMADCLRKHRVPVEEFLA